MAKQIHEITAKTKTLPIETFIPLDYTRNVRDPSIPYETEGLKADIALHGKLKVRPMVHFKDGKFDQLIQGYRRVTSLIQLHKENPTDRKWDTVECDVYSDLEPSQISDLMDDSGNTEPLKTFEIVRSVWMARDANPLITVAALTTMKLGQLNKHWPPSADKKSTDEQEKHHRGNMQMICNPYDLPDEAKNTYYDLVKSGKSISYRKSDWADLRRIFLEETRQNTAYNKQHPGPLFEAKWAEFVKSEEDKSSAVKVKGISVMNRQEMQAIFDNTPSVLVKNQIQCHLRAFGAASDERLIKLAMVLARDVEPSITPEAWANIKAVLAGDFKAAGFSQ